MVVSPFFYIRNRYLRFHVESREFKGHLYNCHRRIMVGESSFRTSLLSCWSRLELQMTKEPTSLSFKRVIHLAFYLCP